MEPFSPFRWVPSALSTSSVLSLIVCSVARSQEVTDNIAFFLRDEAARKLVRSVSVFPCNLAEPPTLAGPSMFWDASQLILGVFVFVRLGGDDAGAHLQERCGSGQPAPIRRQIPGSQGVTCFSCFKLGPRVEPESQFRVFVVVRS